MACEAVHTGSAFLSGVLGHLDCQGRSIGAYGYGALADPGSPVALALTGLLTLFIALFGLRLIAGERPEGRDLVGSMLRIGLFLTLATSWPAWRTIGYDLILDGPSQIASSIGLASGLPGTGNDLVARLQDADDGIVTLTMYGSGRLTGGIAAGSDLGDAARGIALADQTAFGSGRTAYLVTAIGTFGLLRLGAGILLALAPLMAGLVLFAGTMSLFMGWLRGLAFCALASIAFTVLSGAMLALVYPWLSDALAQRQANVFTASAPTELLVLMLAYGVMTAGVLLLIARITFLPAFFAARAARTQPARVLTGSSTALAAASSRVISQADHTSSVVNAVATTVRREGGPRLGGSPSSAGGTAQSAPGTSSTQTTTIQGVDRLGTSHRRPVQRRSAAGRRRDQT